MDEALGKVVVWGDESEAQRRTSRTNVQLTISHNITRLQGVLEDGDPVTAAL